MSTILKGGCRCGGFRYECGSEPLDVRICHCRDCQYASGSAFSVVAYFPVAMVTMHGTSKSYMVKGSAGLSVERHFCPECGTPLYSRLLEMPEVVFIKTGSFDDPNQVSPRGHIWCDSQVKWLRINDELERLPGNPPL
jgi:hypothetical protein